MEIGWVLSDIEAVGNGAVGNGAVGKGISVENSI
jgi:hypothetical protein